MAENPLRPELFRKDAIAEDTAMLNDGLVALMTALPEWWNIGAEITREARRQGRGPFPAPVLSPRARTQTITGRDGNEIKLRIIEPEADQRRLSAYPRRRLGAGGGGSAGPDAGAYRRQRRTWRW